MNLLLKLVSYMKFKEAGVLMYTIKPHGFFYSFYRVSQKKGQADIEILIREKADVELSLLIPFLSVDIPLLLSIQGEGLVQRIYPGKTDELAKHIPNIEIKDYVVQQYELTDDRTFIALLRKERMESILNDLYNLKIAVTNVFLGFYGFIEIPDLFSNDKGNLIVGAHYLEIDNKRVVSVGKSILPDSECQGEELVLKNNETVAIATAIVFFIRPLSQEDSMFSLLQNNYKELAAAKLYKIVLKYLLPAMLGLLLINILLFDHLRNELQAEEITRTDKKNLTTQVERLKKEIGTEKEFGEKANLGKSHAFAFYADRIAALNVAGIRFEELAVDPVKTKIRSEELIGIDRGLIVLKGTVKHAEDFSNLLVLLKNVSWIRKIEKQVYTFDNDTGTAKFVVVISYSDPG